MCLQWLRHAEASFLLCGHLQRVILLRLAFGRDGLLLIALWDECGLRLERLPTDALLLCDTLLVDLSDPTIIIELKLCLVD